MVRSGEAEAEEAVEMKQARLHAEKRGRSWTHKRNLLWTLFAVYLQLTPSTAPVSSVLPAQVLPHRTCRQEYMQSGLGPRRNWHGIGSLKDPL